MTLVALAWPVVFAQPLDAQTDRLELEIAPFAGGAFFLGDGPRSYALERGGSEPMVVEGARYEDGWTAGFGAGLRLSDAFSVQTLFVWVPTWLTGSNLVDGTDVYAYIYGVTGIVRLPLSGPLQPYWGVGMGAKTFDFSGSIHSRTQWTTTFVAGMSFDLGAGQSIHREGRDLLAPFDSGLTGVPGGWENDLMITAGMSWRIPLGRQKPRPTVQRGRGGLFPG